MKARFAALVQSMEPLLDQLQASESIPLFERKKLPKKPGVYLLSETGNNLYVGRTKDVRARMHGHVGKSHTTATFALKLARLAAARPTTYTTKDSTKTLMDDEIFKPIFVQAVDRVLNMQIQHVVIEDDHQQYLFEMYASLILGVPHCDFATH